MHHPIAVDFDPVVHHHHVKSVSSNPTVKDTDFIDWGVNGVDNTDKTTIASNDPNFVFGGKAKGVGTITSGVKVALGVAAGTYNVSYSITLNNDPPDPVSPFLVIDTIGGMMPKPPCDDDDDRRGEGDHRHDHQGDLA